MLTIFRYTLARFRGQVLGWGVALFLLASMTASMYDSVFRANEDKMKELLKTYPRELLVTFGAGNSEDPVEAFNPADPEKFLSMEFFSFMPLILGVFAVLAGSGLLAADEENGTLDLLLAHPISRTGLFVGRLLGFAASTVLILAIAWLGWAVWLGGSSLIERVDRPAVALPFLSLLAVLLFFGALALLLSLLLPSRRLAAMTAGLALVVSFFLTSLARVNPAWEVVGQLSPLTYYQSGQAIRGLNVGWFAGLLAVAGLFAVTAWRLFERRDVRVVGEGTWRWPWRRQKAAAGRV
jgi:ABC-2 type transport system permease protein